jgi:hypothetical protein
MSADKLFTREVNTTVFEMTNFLDIIHRLSTFLPDDRADSSFRNIVCLSSRIDDG